MNDKICINYNTFILFMIIIIGIFYLFFKDISQSQNINLKKIIINNEERNLSNKSSDNMEVNEDQQNDNNKDEGEQENDDSVLVSGRYFNPKSYKPLVDKLIDERDQKALEDPFTAPTRRMPRHIYPTEKSDYIFEVPTRGYPDSYHALGILKRNEDEKTMQLFGRQIYPGANQYEYYVRGVESDLEIKHPIDVKNGREIYDGDEIDIDFLDPSKGKFKYFANNFDKPRYNPFVIN